MSEQEKRCSAYLRTWKKRKRCSYKAVNNGRCRRHQEKTAQREATQPAIEGDVVDRVAKAIYDSNPECRYDASGVAEDATWEEIQGGANYYRNLAKAAIAAMQPAIDKAVAEERARCERLCSIYFDIAAGAIGEDEVRLLRDKAIEQGGGDA